MVLTPWILAGLFLVISLAFWLRARSAEQEAEDWRGNYHEQVNELREWTAKARERECFIEAARDELQGAYRRNDNARRFLTSIGQQIADFEQNESAVITDD